MSRTQHMVWMACICVLGALSGLSPGAARAAEGYQIAVSNERSNDVTDHQRQRLLDPRHHPGRQAPARHPCEPRRQARLRGHERHADRGASAARRARQSHFQTRQDDDDDDSEADKSADGIGIIDVASRKLKGKIFAGSDPEEFALSKDGKQIYVSNEDTKSASVVNIAT